MKEFFRAFLGSCLGVLITFGLLMLILFGIIGAMLSGDEEVTVADNTILRIDLSQPVVDRASGNPLKNIDLASLETSKEIGLNTILENIRKAKSDPKIVGIYMDLNTVNVGGFATLEEIRNAILDFRKSKKFVVAYSDTYSQIAYYLATAADKIYLNPEGNIELLGLKAQVMFYKGTLDKLQVKAQIIRHGKFKSAIEPFILDKMSPANREQYDALLGSIWGTIVDGISTSRNISAEDINAYANNISITDGKDAVKHNFIDAVLYKDELTKQLSVFAKLSKDKEPEAISISDYSRAKEEGKKYPSQKISVIYASGEVVMGSDAQNLSEKNISQAIRQARKDKNTKAIVLRVNSPGGSALASDIIWREMTLARKAKPVVVSMGDYAASGGYYITVPADVIFAQPTTLTGSIGVFGILFDIEKGMRDKLGITVDYAKTNAHADMGTPFRMLDSSEEEVLQKEVERVYTTFTSHVAQGRHLNVAYVDSIGQGRVWSGKMAQGLKLVDKMGGLNEAIAEAAKLAKIKEYRTEELPLQKDFLTELLNDFSSSSLETYFAKNKLGETFESYNELKSFIQNEGVQARMPFWIRIK